MTATPKGAASNPRKVDWALIERDYRAGIKVLRAIAGEHGITEGAIRKRAKADGWSRDLAERIRQKADELVRKDAVRKASTQSTQTDPATERVVVEANAMAIAEVIRGHRRQIGAAQALTERMLAELTQQTDSPELLERLAEAMVDPDGEDAAKWRDEARKAVRRALALPGRASTLKTLSEAMKNLIVLERQAFRVDETTDESLPQQQATEAQQFAAEAMLAATARLAAVCVAPE